MADLSLAQIIRDKQQELADAERRVLQLRAELLEAGRLLGAGAAPSPTAAKIKPPASSTELAELVLNEAKIPLHVNQIIAGIEQHYGVSVRYATLVGNISRLVKQHRTFERVGPNIFGLVVWHADREAEELFGRERYEETDSSHGLEKRL